MGRGTFYFVFNAAVILLHAHAWFVVSRLLRRNDVADIAWGAGFAIVAVLDLAIRPEHSAFTVLPAICVTLWGLRLSGYLYLRNRARAEDYRYEQMRRNWRRPGLESYLKVFLFQGLLMYLILLPITWSQSLSLTPAWNWLSAGGLGVWACGFGIEALADHQLRRFKSQAGNRGRVMQSGLWRYSRHPNYFGEVLLWWGIFLMVLPAPRGWMTIVSPLSITILILWVSGIPLLEKKYVGQPEYESYKAKTSVFFPWPPSKRI